jgi:hypothetical protein
LQNQKAATTQNRVVEILIIKIPLGELRWVVVLENKKESAKKRLEAANQ